MSERSDGRDREIREELAVFGFSDTEIDAYLAILAHDEATTRTIAEAADVTQRAVYNIAERLADRGLVRVKEHASPTTISAVPPDDAIENLTTRLESIRPQLAATYDETAETSPDIRIIKSRETALKRLRQAIELADHEIVISIPQAIYPEIESALQAANERGVLVLLLLGDYEGDTDPAPFEPVADVVRYWDEHLPFLYAVDNYREGMVGEAPVLAGPHHDGYAVYVTEAFLTSTIFSMFIATYWPAAKELSVTSPDPLPETFEWFRHAVLQAALSDSESTTLRAEVETASDERLTGRITDVVQQLIEPRSETFSLQHSLCLETADGPVTVGGHDSFLEGYEAESVRLLSEE
ncbi:TrmB family transcriptional regulator [Halorhabdus sp. CUG00001]|uniref:TrmB family transcriptional regulator n=1 Tax=Halorhabdus sp. CUG00001 TaxID=2600297 RepID=UPI00131BAAB9|nr:TrmB family transcriptional regulator sugar-binding domain-containing protein [Halorhabdus sp. CUG00001]